MENVVITPAKSKISLKNRAVIAVGSAMMALNTLAISAFAAEGDSTDYVNQAVTSMSTELSSLVGKVAVGAAGLVGVALTLFGIKWAVRHLRSFFNSTAG